MKPGWNKALLAAHKKREEMRLAGITPERLSPMEKHRLDPNSLRKALNAHCFMCMGGGDDGGWRKMIANCTSERICPLWPLRPYQHLSDDA